ncbi:MAG: deoxyhypusine synthase [Ardenticatenia bacterium]|nr:deoxyhypusine synthase [Ardenticatenia bacterium]
MYGRKLAPGPIPADLPVTALVDDFFLAYNAARLREACHLFVEQMLEPDTTVCLTISGALTPAGLGHAAFVPLIEAGFVDWIVTTGANLYHDLHRSLGFELYQTSPLVDDVRLREEGIIRIYDIVFEQDVLFETDAFIRRALTAPEFRGRMGTAEFHHHLGRYVRERERLLGLPHRSLLGAAYEAGVPIYTPAPGDSGLGMNVAALRLQGREIGFDPELDVNETAAIVYGTKRAGGKSGLLILGGGTPKNFALQTEPQIQEVLGLDERGHDYFVQITDARPDTGGLSGATPSEAVTWGKVDPNQLPNTVVCYADTTIALPILVAYALAKRPPRPLKRLYERRAELLDALRTDDLARPADAGGGRT